MHTDYYLLLVSTICLILFIHSLPMKLDILAFGAHPDDIELACSGTLVKHIRAGKKAGIVDLTQGELGTRGNAALRKKEALAASKILGVNIRENLNLGDGFFQNSKEAQLEVIKRIRLYQPEIVLANAVKDRHPDHGRASLLVSEACFLAGLVKIKTTLDGKSQKPWRPKAVYHYVQDRYIKPDFVIDISDFFDLKMKSIKAYSTQFYDPSSKEPQTAISTPEFLDFVKGRAVNFGRDIGVRYAEGFTVERVIGVHDLFDIL